MILRMIGIEAMPATSGSSLPRCGFRNSTGYNTGVCQAIASLQKKKKKKKKKKCHAKTVVELATRR